MNKAEKALRTYEFLGWLDDFVQSREGRSNLPMMEQEENYFNAEETNFYVEDVTIETAEDAIEESQSNSESIEI